MIRKITINDYDNYLLLINKFRKTYFTQEQFQNTLIKLQNNNNFIWIYEYDNKIIATSTLIIQTKFIFNISYVGMIEDVFVEENYRNLGIGKKMILYLIKEAKKYNCYKIICVCLEYNKNFYIKCNFEHRGNFMSKLL